MIIKNAWRQEIKHQAVSSNTMDATKKLAVELGYHFIELGLIQLTYNHSLAPLSGGRLRKITFVEGIFLQWFCNGICNHFECDLCIVPTEDYSKINNRARLMAFKLLKTIEQANLFQNITNAVMIYFGWNRFVSKVFNVPRANMLQCVAIKMIQRALIPDCKQISASSRKQRNYDKSTESENQQSQD